MPTFSVCQARSDDAIFILLSHIENTTFALHRSQASPESTVFGDSFPVDRRTFTRRIRPPRGKPTSYHERRTCMLTLLEPCACVAVVFSSAVSVCKRGLCIACHVISY